MATVETLEKELDRPVITSNSTALWLALVRLGIDTSNVKVGRLFRQSRSSLPRLHDEVVPTGDVP